MPTSEIQPGHFLARSPAPACDASECGQTVQDSSSGSAREILAGLSRMMPKAAYTPSTPESRPDTSTLAAADFDVDVRSGFLPPEPPLERLPGPSYDVQHTTYDSAEPSLWESMFDWAKSIPLEVGAKYTDNSRAEEARRWRRAVRAMPVVPLSDQELGHIRTARRACLVLAFLSHLYMHAQPDVGQYEADVDKAAAIAAEAAPAPKAWYDFWSTEDAEASAEARGEYVGRLPGCLATPLQIVSEHLGLPPVLTYATTVLWNWTLKDPSAGLVADNMQIKETFTATSSEAHFYLISLLIELQGVEALTLMRISLNEAFAVDELAEKRIACYLEELAGIIRKLTKLLGEMYPGCDPNAFYWQIRPWFRAGDATYSVQESNRGTGWFLESQASEPEHSMWTGPSAGQSTLIHALDLFLDVDHARTKRPKDGEAAPDTRPASDATFMERMQMYMPLYHRAFLRHLQHGISTEPAVGPPREGAEPESSDHPIRALVLRCRWAGEDHPLVKAYDEALRALRSLRDEHMRIAMQYIVKPARAGPPNAKRSAAPKDGEIRGTGGTALVSFLSDCRKNTTDAMVERMRRA